MTTLSWMVGLRYLSARKGSRFVSLFALASILGMAVSVMAMVVVLSVMNGFEGTMRDRILKAVPHGQLVHPGGIADWPSLAEQLRTQPGVLGVAPQHRARVLVAANGRVHGGELFGVDPAREAQVSELDQSIIAGDWEALAPGTYGVVIGRSLARQLRIGVGEGINLILPRVSVTPLGLFPRSRHFTVVGVFAVGAQPDSSQLYIHLQDADRLLRQAGKVDALRLHTADVMTAPQQLARLASLPALAGFEVRSWRDEHRTLFNAMHLEKVMVTLMLSVIVVVATFNLVSILTMAVADRRLDIAVLRTLGASRRDVLGIFLVYGMAMGWIGIGAGLVLGSATAVWLPTLMEALATRIPFIMALPSIWQWQQAAGIALLSMLLCLLAVSYPAWRASTIHPAEALRYE